uniref:Deoxyribonuclease-1 n=1 Tax=Calidris pygmaea TaxID=425635 RepID=A0A8C3JKK7_9CHAR
MASSKLVVSLLVAALLLHVAVTLKISAFNIRTFGDSKMSNKTIANIIVSILSGYDITLVQEVRDADLSSVEKLMDQLNSASPHPYNFLISTPLGRTSYKEQYLFIYRSDLVSVLGSYYYDDGCEPCGTDTFSREPFIVKFSSPTTQHPLPGRLQCRLLLRDQLPVAVHPPALPQRLRVAHPRQRRHHRRRHRLRLRPHRRLRHRAAPRHRARLCHHQQLPEEFPPPDQGCFGRQRPFPGGGDPESPLSPSPHWWLPGCPGTHPHPSWEPSHHQCQPSCPPPLQGADLQGLVGVGCSSLPLKNEHFQTLKLWGEGPFSPSSSPLYSSSPSSCQGQPHWGWSQGGPWGWGSPPAIESPMWQTLLPSELPAAKTGTLGRA